MTLPSVSRVAAAAAAAVLGLAGAAALFAAQGVSSAGIRWTIPAGWTDEGARPMRVATYRVPAAPGAETGECGVFYFGKGQGGSIEENIARWGQQFEGGGKPKVTVTTISGLKVHRVETAGTYLAPGGPMMQSTGKKPGYRLLGAIIEAPDGNVFFKFTGPAVTLAASEKAFDGMIKSIEKAPAAKF